MREPGLDRLSLATAALLEGGRRADDEVPPAGEGHTKKGPKFQYKVGESKPKKQRGDKAAPAAPDFTRDVARAALRERYCSRVNFSFQQLSRQHVVE